MFNIFVTHLRVKCPKITPNRIGKVHDYSQCDSKVDYIFESIDGGNRGYMTGQKPGIQPGDYVLLLENRDQCRYQVEKVDYYSNQQDIWIALLKKVLV